MTDNLHMQAAVHAWMVECFGVAVTVDVVERADRFIEEALELAQATGWTADRGHALVDYVFGRPAGQIGQEVGGVMVTLCALCNTHGVDTDAEAWREINRILQPDMVLKIRAKQAAKPTGSALPGPSSPKQSTDGYVAAFYEIAEMLGVGAKTYSPAEAFERDIKPRVEQLNAVRSAAAAVVGGAVDNYRKRNGAIGSIEGDDGEKCWIVSFDAIEALRAALAGDVHPDDIAVDRLSEGRS